MGACESREFDNVASIDQSYPSRHKDTEVKMVEQNPHEKEIEENSQRLLIESSTANQTDVLESLLQKNVDINVRNSFDYTPLFIAAEKGNLKTVRCLVESGAVVNYETKDHLSIVDRAIMNEHLDVVRYLVENGACVNVDSLNQACKLGNIETAKYIVEQQVDVNACVGTDRTVFNEASKVNLELVRLLMANGGDITRVLSHRSPLFDACMKGHFDVVKYWVELGADVNVESKSHVTPLFMACRLGSFDVIEYLVTQGADVNHADENGFTPLLYLTEFGHLKCLEYLLEQGANLHINQDTENSPLYLAAESGHLDVFKLLLSQGADAGEKAGNRIIRCADSNDHWEVSAYMHSLGYTK